MSPITHHGRLTRDVEIRFSKAGTAIGSTSIAVNERKKDEKGNWVDGDASFFNVVAFGQMAEMMAETLAKGDLVLATGEEKQRNYETKEGEKRTSYKMYLNDIGPSLKWLPKDRPSNKTGSTLKDDYSDEVPF
jgi:single-strand DNA-binding protein